MYYHFQATHKLLIKHQKPATFMRRLLLLATFLFLNAPFLKATHIYGGDFYYRYIGDSTNIQHHYEIYFVNMGLMSGANPPISYEIDVQSSCFPSRTLQLDSFNYAGFRLYIQGFERCSGFSNPGVVPVVYDTYKKDIVLNGPCADWTFSLQRCCLDTKVNILGSPQVYSFIHLDNTLGPNTSPVFDGLRTLAACRNQLYTFPQVTNDPDIGDSVRYVFAPLMSNPTFPSTMAPGYNFQTPFNSNTPNVLDAATGLLRFHIPINTLLGGYAYSTHVENYRFNPATASWVLIGHSQRINMVYVFDNCDSVALAGPILSLPPYNQLGPPPTTPTLSMQCNDTSLVLHFQPDVDCRSISSDASEFRLVDPNGVPIPIIRADAVCSPPFHSTTSIALKFGRPLDSNGTYVMELKTGNDGDLLLNTCGFPMQNPGILHLDVVNCTTGVVSVFDGAGGALLWGAAFPQPQHGLFQVPYQGGKSQMVHFKLTNLLGQVVAAGQQQLEPATGTLFFDATNWPSGSYLLYLETEIGHHTQKITVL